MTQAASSNSLKKNFSYKLTLNFALYALNFVTFPYVTRVLGAENFGTVNFIISTIDYFMLFATMGMSVLGMREIAAARNDERQLSDVFSRLFGLNLMFTLAVSIAYMIAIFTVPKFHSCQHLFLVGLIRIVSNIFYVDWVFAGLERFKYMSLSTALVKLIYVVSIFIMVRTPDDYPLYFYATVGFTVLSCLLNSVYVSRFVSLRPKLMIGKRYLRENCLLGISTIAQNFYITFNVMFLGFVSTDVEVGYYSTAAKLYLCCVSLFGAFTSIMSPRMASLLATGNHRSHADFVKRSCLYALLAGTVVAAGGLLLAPYIIRIIAGSDYDGAIMPLRLLVIALIPQFISQVMIYQVLVPMKRDSVLLGISLSGCLLYILFNFLFVPHLAAVGSSVTLLLCELTVMTVYIIYCHRKRLLQFTSTQ